MMRKTKRQIIKALYPLARLYWRVVKPRTFGVRAIVTSSDGLFLLVKHSYDDFWYLPGGAKKNRETAEQAIGREIAEETGLQTLRVLKKLGTYVSDREGKADTIDVFVCWTEASTLNAGDEILAVRWFAFDALPDEISPATLRRLNEYLENTSVASTW
jgi:ADP-ribose pyrophosphatase YjhB (NUDIX family)